MPLYEYECEHCGKRFEQIQKFSDPPTEVCPKCGEGPVRKLMSSPAIQFKGSGWYITDYARKDGGAKAPSDSSAAEKTDSSKAAEGSAKSGDARTDTKTETKTTTATETKSSAV
jgi:putative FmdB family regulatory protein